MVTQPGQGGSSLSIGWIWTRNLKVSIVYLGAQAADGVHISQFRSTHQYYETAKYELDRITRDGDSPCCLIPHPTIPIPIRLLARPTMLEPNWSRWEIYEDRSNILSWAWVISASSDPIKPILCSSVVLMSTSKLWNMNSIGRLSFEIDHQNLQFSVQIQPIERDEPPWPSWMTIEFQRNYGWWPSNRSISELRRSWITRRWSCSSN